MYMLKVWDNETIFFLLWHLIISLNYTTLEVSWKKVDINFIMFIHIVIQITYALSPITRIKMKKAAQLNEEQFSY